MYPSMNARLTLIAHGATEAQKRAAFPEDEPVLEDRLAAIAKLNWRAPGAQQVVSAPELRARQTAQALGLSVEIDDDLRDCDYGKWRGRAMSEVQSADPEGLLAWLKDPEASPHGGEAFVDLIVRVGQWMDRQTDSGHTIAVTHPAVMRCAIVHALGVSATLLWRFDVTPFTLTDLRFNGNVWTARSIGSSLAAQD